eukprot:15883413-Heterocapsa_arctica.AAC.1
MEGLIFSGVEEQTAIRTMSLFAHTGMSWAYVWYGFGCQCWVLAILTAVEPLDVAADKPEHEVGMWRIAGL